MGRARLGGGGGGPPAPPQRPPLVLAPAHAVWLDTRRGELYCRDCRDYVYDPAFDDAALVGRGVEERGWGCGAVGGRPPSPPL